jgi:hypothetical protein
MYANNLSGSWSVPQSIVDIVGPTEFDLAVDAHNNWHLVYNDFAYNTGITTSYIKHLDSTGFEEIIAQGTYNGAIAVGDFLQLPRFAAGLDGSLHVIYSREYYSGSSGGPLNTSLMYTNNPVGNIGTDATVDELTIDTIAPTSDLSHPITSQFILSSVINVSKRYIDVTFTDTGGSGLDLSTIIDSGQEFALGGSAASGIVVDGVPTLQSGTTYRYNFTGDFGLGPVDVNLIVGSWADNSGNTNVAETETFTVSLSLFGSQQVITTQFMVVTVSVYACDLDGDGDSDVLSASVLDNKVAWYENLGDGTFGSQQVITTQAGWAYSVYACDLYTGGPSNIRLCLRPGWRR